MADFVNTTSLRKMSRANGNRQHNGGFPATILSTIRKTSPRRSGACEFSSRPKLKAHVDGSDARQFIRAAAANDLDRLDAMLKVRPYLVAAPWSYGDAPYTTQ